MASRTTTEPEYRFDPSRKLVAKSGAGLPPGTYNNPVSGSKLYEVQVAPPVIGTPCSELPHVDTLRGDAPSGPRVGSPDRKSTRLNSSHLGISYAVFCLKKKKRHA